MAIVYQVYDLTSDGRGVTKRPDGRVMLVDGAVPGDHVVVSIGNEGLRGPLLAEVEEIIVPSADRVDHPCTHHHRGCPGSPLGALRYDAALNWKIKHLRETLKRIGGIIDPLIEDPIPSPYPSGYRDRLEFRLHFSRKQWSPVYFTRYRTISINDCMLGMEPVRSALNMLAYGLNENRLAPPDGRWKRGLRLLIRDNGADAAIAVLFVVANRHVDPEPFAPWLNNANLAGWQICRTPSMNARYFKSTVDGENGDTNVLYPVTVIDTVQPTQKPGTGFFELNKSISAPPTIFTQANRNMVPGLVSTVLEYVSPDAYLLDLYGGYGSFALSHAIRGGRSTVVESTGEAVKAGQNFAEANNYPAHYVIGDLGERAFINVPLDRFDAIILDPPRRGAHTPVLDLINDKGTGRIIYVSCHPAALARDLKRLTHYKPEKFIPIDLFPHTADLETIAVLRRS